jgi:hypothetical protein
MVPQYKQFSIVPLHVFLLIVVNLVGHCWSLRPVQLVVECPPTK